MWCHIRLRPPDDITPSPAAHRPGRHRKRQRCRAAQSAAHTRGDPVERPGSLSSSVERPGSFGSSVERAPARAGSRRRAGPHAAGVSLASSAGNASSTMSTSRSAGRVSASVAGMPSSSS